VSNVVEHGDPHLHHLNGGVFKEDIGTDKRSRRLQASPRRTAVVAFADRVVRAARRDVEDDADHLQSMKIWRRRCR